MAGVLRGSISRLLTTTNAPHVLKAGVQSLPAKNPLSKSDLWVGGAILVTGVMGIPLWVTYKIPQWTADFPPK